MLPADLVARPSSPSIAVWLSALRPAEWTKSGFVLAPLLFSGRFTEVGPLARASAAAIAFCAIASAGYLLNDVLDRELDRQHPRKRTRPIASGRISAAAALRASVALALIALAIAAPLGWEVTALVAGYAVLAAAYSLGLKRIVILDVMILAAFFLIRVTAGSAAVDVSPSEWLLCFTATLALLLGFTKRRQELAAELAGPTRPVLDRYGLGFVDQMITFSVTATVVSYAVYAIDSPLIGGRMLITAPPLLYGIFRYVYLIVERRDPRPTSEIVMRDPGMLAALAAYCVSAAILIAAR
jgi:4-hydroxybenzoate polyprenyltransferase